MPVEAAARGQGDSPPGTAGARSGADGSGTQGGGQTWPGPPDPSPGQRRPGPAAAIPLRPREGLRFDPARLATLYAELGASGAERLLDRAGAELTLILFGMEGCYATGRFSDFGRHQRCLERLADHIGAAGLADAARGLGDCLAAGQAGSLDPTALAATWARLRRLAERTLSANWDQRGVSR